MNIDPDLILSFFNIDKTKLKGEPILIVNKKSVEIYIDLKDDNPRECPYCHSHKVYIDDNMIQKKKFSIVQNEEIPIFLMLHKKKYHCLECGHKYWQQTQLCEKNFTISNPIHWKVFEDLAEDVTYKSVAKKYHLSTPQVLVIFDRMAHYKRQPLTKAISIDEKRFYTEEGNYICVITDAITGDILDIFPGRTNNYLFDYFEKIPLKERENVQFIASDMYGGFKTMAKKYFPNAIHIIDFFHVKQEFIWSINKIRNEYQKSFDVTDFECKVLKNSWALLLRDHTKPRTIKHKKLKRLNEIDEEKGIHYKDDKGNLLTFKDALEYTLNKTPYLTEILQIYDDFNRYVIFGDPPETINDELEFIINRLLTSECKHTIKIGKTFKQFKQQIINSYSSINYLHISNARAEGNNNLIESLIKHSYGLNTFSRFRNRVIHIKRHKKTGNN